MTKSDSDFETDDIYQAAWYKMAGCEYLGRRKQGNKVLFSFQSHDHPMREYRERFFSGKAQVPAYEYSRELKRFKELVFD